MKWEKQNNQSVEFYTGIAEGINPKDAAVEMWKLFNGDIVEKNRGVEWDFIRVEFWADSGRVIVFPASSRSVERIEKAGCQIVFPALLESYEELADSEISDAEFSEKLVEIEAKWAEDIADAAQGSGLSQVCIEFWDADADAPFNKATL